MQYENWPIISEQCVFRHKKYVLNVVGNNKISGTPQKKQRNHMSV